MNVDPKQSESLISTFCEMNDEFREKAVAAVNKVFFRLCHLNGLYEERNSCYKRKSSACYF